MHFLHIALFRQLTFLENIVHMAGNDRLITFKKLDHLRLCQPDGFIPELDIQGCLSVFGLIEDDFSVIGG